MSNDTTVSVAAAGGAFAVVAVFIATTLGLDVPAAVAAAVATLFTAGLGLVLPRTAK